MSTEAPPDQSSVGTRLDFAADIQAQPAAEEPSNSFDDAGTPQSKTSPAAVEEPCCHEESKETVPLLQQVGAEHQLART